MRFVRTNQAVFLDALEKRGARDLGQQLIEKDREWRDVQAKLDELRSEKNALAKDVAKHKNTSDEYHKVMSLSKSVAKKIEDIEKICDELKDQVDVLALSIPNLPANDVPNGKTEDENIVIKVFGKKKHFDFPPLRHDEIGVSLGLSVKDGVLLGGSRFVVLYDKLARLERALAAFMLDEHRKRGYIEISVPYMVRQEIMYGSGNLPKFGEDAFSTTNGMYLIPTSEVSLVNLGREKVFSYDELPLNMTAYTPCFRSEVGSAGKANHGLTRVHQFHKVELVKIVHPDKSAESHEEMVLHAENILEKLGLHYRRMLLCSQEMGFSACKTYDLEVWLPGEEVYREISSCSNCSDFQARRMHSKIKIGSEFQYVHTLNGSGLAVGRTMIAILENYQQKDGSVLIPDVLKSYLDFEVINPIN